MLATVFAIATIVAKIIIGTLALAVSICIAVLGVSFTSSRQNGAERNGWVPPPGHLR